MKWIACCLLFTPLMAMATGYLENPQPNSIQSGISIISGWHCTADEVEVLVDGVSIGGTGVGSIRDDTVSVCGHNKGGYALLYNYNIPAPGEHEVSVYAGGTLLERRKFKTVRSGGAPFLSGNQPAPPLPTFRKTVAQPQSSGVRRSKALLLSEAQMRQRLTADTRFGGLQYRPKIMDCLTLQKPMESRHQERWSLLETHIDKT